MKLTTEISLKRFVLIFTIILFSVLNVFASDTKTNRSIKIINISQKGFYNPLDWIEVNVTGSANCFIRDGAGREYFRTTMKENFRFQVAGALGTHTILQTDNAGTLLETFTFKVDCKTEIRDENAEFEKLLDMLYFTMHSGHTTAHYRYKGKSHVNFAGWFQDHVHTMKALKYFYPDVTSGIDLYADGQRADGMIYDNYYLNYNTYTSWLNRFGPEFVQVPKDPKMNSSFFVRIPVENMSEFTFLEAVYYAWKATGDDEWMAGKLDNCLKAIKYSTSDPYRWSDKFQLLKRGYTIDIWDFQPTEDIKVWGGDIMMAKPGITNYSVMYGDNIGMAVGCEYVAEMLGYVGRHEEAERTSKLARDIKSRIDQLAWNGEFYTHHVPENPNIKRDFGGTDESAQVTISNAYAINRRIGRDKARAILKTYQKIAGEMPESSAGEWYLCYPPYEKGWHMDKWEYMNGGVSSIVAGEVAHGAFELGFEKYGVHVLRRMWELAQLTNNRLKCIYRGAMPEKPERTFTTIGLQDAANADFAGTGAKGVPGWTGENENDLHEFPSGKQVFQDVPFEIVDPATNGRKACLILTNDKNYTLKQTLNINKKAASLYIVHAQSYGNNVGNITLYYADGSHYVKYINRGENINGWWYPKDGPYNEGHKAYRVAWTGKNAKCNNVGVYIYGINNPYKDKKIKSIVFNGVESNSKWMICGVTLGHEPVFFMPEKYSYGAPDNWGAAAVVYALFEGLAGIKDTGVAFNKAKLAPRWSAAHVNNVRATVKYEASGGYLSYLYKYDEVNAKLDLTFTGTAAGTQIDLLLPENKTVSQLLLNGDKTDFKLIEVEQSLYARFRTDSVKAHYITLSLK